MNTRTLSMRCVAVGCALLLTAGCGPSPAPASPDQPRYVTVMLRDAAIAPTKPDGRAWDCCGDISPDTAGELSGALRSSFNPYMQYAAVVTLLAPLAGAGTIPPEVFGSAQLYTNAEPQQRIQFNRPWQQDSYTPLLTVASGPPTWSHVPLDPGTRIVGSLWDNDVFEDDPIGPFDINYGHLVAALQSDALYPVRVDSTVLFVRISVMAEQ